MSRQDRIGQHATTIATVDGVTIVTYHRTQVVRWIQGADTVILDHGGWMTLTTKTRMNQAANQFGLPYHVYQKDYEWYVTVTYADGTTDDLLFDGRTVTVEW